MVKSIVKYITKSVRVGKAFCQLGAVVASHRARIVSLLTAAWSTMTVGRRGMIQVTVCVGSSCHLKGSYQVIRRLQELLAASGVEDAVELSGSFCLGSCGRGVTVRVGETLFPAVLPHEVDEFFTEHIKPHLGV